MAWSLEEQPDGRWKWSVMQSAYGAAGGVRDTRDEAVVDMVIAEHSIMEQPLPPTVCEVMRADPSRFAKDYDHE